jgi:YihY family inner membrane protein
LPLVLGTLGATITGTTLLGQFERALNRLYGIERDRPTLQKYGRALLLTLTAGVLTAIAFAVMTFGREWSLDPGSTAATIWNLVRWPLAWALLAAATAVIFRVSPRRRQPAVSWLLGGAIVGVALVVLATVGLDALFRLSTTFGDTYGPLAGLVALLFWAVATAVSILFGAALTAQLEAVRAGVPEPQREEPSAPRPDPTPAGRAPVAVR